MNCKKVRSLLSPFFDGELPEHTRVTLAEHLLDCVRCSEALEDFKALRQLLKLKEQLTIMPSLWSRTAAELRAEDRPKPWFAQIHTPWLSRAAAFASAVLLIGSFLFIGLKIIPNGQAESERYPESGPAQTTQAELLAPGFVADANQLTKDTLLSIILSDNGAAEHK